MQFHAELILPQPYQAMLALGLQETVLCTSSVVALRSSHRTTRTSQLGLLYLGRAHWTDAVLKAILVLIVLYVSSCNWFTQ